MTEKTAALRAQGLVKRFGRRVAVSDVSFSLEAGRCLALFGPNGAGKTTLLRMLGGLQRPSAGTVEVHGKGVTGAAARRMVGLISHRSLLYPALTARENVVFAAECHGISNSKAMADRALGLLQIADRADTTVRLLSRGMQQRVSIARALVHAPRVLLLDEPYTGLDDNGANALTNALSELRHEGAAMILVTHQLHEGLALADEISVMVKGRVVLHESRQPNAPEAQEFALRYRSLIGREIADGAGDAESGYGRGGYLS